MIENKKLPYGGLPRVSNIVKEVYGEVESGWLDMCDPIEGESKIVSEQEILEWSSAFGTMVHAQCLEGDRTSRLNMAILAKKYYDEWFREYCPARLKVERKVIHKDKLYGGTVDMLCYIGGEKWLIDLKVFGWWKKKFGYILSRDPFPSYKAVKVNLQTNLYSEGLGGGHKRGCLILHPEGWMFHEFKRKSTKIEEALEVAKKQKEENKQYLLNQF